MNQGRYRLGFRERTLCQSETLGLYHRMGKTCVIWSECGRKHQGCILSYFPKFHGITEERHGKPQVSWSSSRFKPVALGAWSKSYSHYTGSYWVSWTVPSEINVTVWYPGSDEVITVLRGAQFQLFKFPTFHGIWKFIVIFTSPFPNQ